MPMRAVVIWLSLGALAAVCYAQGGTDYDLPFRSHLEQLHKWGAHKTFIWQVSTQYRIDENGRANVYRGITSLVIARSGDSVSITGDAFDLPPIGMRKGGLRLVSGRGWVLDASEGYSAVAAVWPVPGDVLSSINSCRYEAFVFPPGEFFYGYFAATNPLAWLDTEWEVVNTDAKQWVLKARLPKPLSAVLYPEVNARLTLSRPHAGSPAVLELDYGGIKKVYRTTKFMQLQGYWLPSEVRYTASTHSGWMHQESILRLVEVRDTESVKIDVPIRTQVNDFRLAGPRLNYQECITVMNEQKNVTYFWEGRLPDIVELKRLAFEQGKLPPAHQAVRFSWWLIVPGVLLIVWAFLTYWRWRRKVSIGEG